MRHGDHLGQSMLHENNLYPWEPMLLAKQECQESDEGQTSWYEILNFRMSTSQALQRKMHSVQEPRFWDQICRHVCYENFEFFLRLGIEWN